MILQLLSEKNLEDFFKLFKSGCFLLKRGAKVRRFICWASFGAKIFEVFRWGLGGGGRFLLKRGAKVRRRFSSLQVFSEIFFLAALLAVSGVSDNGWRTGVPGGGLFVFRWPCLPGLGVRQPGRRGGSMRNREIWEGAAGSGPVPDWRLGMQR